MNDNKFPDLMTPAIDHKESEDDDCGLPENPIFSDYSKYLWRTRIRSGGVQPHNSFQKNTNGH